MRHRHRTLRGTAPIAAFWLVATCAGVGTAADEAAPGASQPASTRASRFLALEPVGCPPGVTTAAECQAYLQAELREMRERAGRSTTPEARARAWLDLATFALVRGTEPELSRTWLGLTEPDGQAMALRALALARDALALASEAEKQRSNGRDGGSLSGSIRMLNALAGMESSLLTEVGSAESLQAAREAERLCDALPEAAQPAWELLIAACLYKADRDQDALLRLQDLLRGQKAWPAGLAAAVLQSRILAEAGSHAVAVALISEYVQVFGALPQAKAADMQEGGPSARGPADADQARTAMCTLLHVKAELLSAWARQLQRSDSPYDRQAATTLEGDSARYSAQAEVSGPYVIRLMPVLELLSRPAGGQP